ncbi:serpin-ZX-like [Rhododendron vialii]|uniref:serpin-ZX-like n=1 Tax=Rhododendron vialii TaxID=182163 RepID=UPI00265DAD08|nr:serpin-ZX-like [Rhododendron vialii]
MASDEKKKESAENVTGRAKRQKVSTKNLPLAPTDPIPSTKITKSRLDFSTAMAKQLLLEQVEKGSNANFALSPLSIDVVLTMVAAGSRGRTLERVLALLGAQDIDEIKSSASEMMAAAAGCGGGRRSDEGGDGLVLCMVNGAWVDKRFPLIDSYKEEVLKGICACNAETVDFQKEANEVVKKVNSWAEEASKGLITNLLQPQSLSSQTAIVLANGLYFKGTWTSAHRFDESLTRKRTFYLLTGDTVSIPFMTSRKKYHYKSFDAFKVLKVPYKSAKLDRKFSMYFFLPHEKVGLQNLLKELCSDSGFLKQDYFNIRKVSLAKFWIPKFKLSYEFDIAKTMKKIGMTFPFTENPEDFSEMMKIPKGIPFLSISMTQKVVVKVDEKGTEAAAVTRARLRSLSYKRSLPKPSFVADHPFLFMIKEKMSGLVFFMGAVLNPSL